MSRQLALGGPATGALVGATAAATANGAFNELGREITRSAVREANAVAHRTRDYLKRKYREWTSAPPPSAKRTRSYSRRKMRPYRFLDKWQRRALYRKAHPYKVMWHRRRGVQRGAFRVYTRRRYRWKKH